MENPDLVYQQAGYSQSLTHSRPAECGSRQAIPARPDNSQRVVSPSRGLPGNMQQVAPTSNRPLCDEVQPYAFPPATILGKSGGEVAGLPMQKHSDFSGVAQHALVLGSIIIIIMYLCSAQYLHILQDSKCYLTNPTVQVQPQLTSN